MCLSHQIDQSCPDPVSGNGVPHVQPLRGEVGTSHIDLIDVLQLHLHGNILIFGK